MRDIACDRNVTKADRQNLPFLIVLLVQTTFDCLSY
jgi:hypothetical protein